MSYLIDYFSSSHCIGEITHKRISTCITMSIHLIGIICVLSLSAVKDVLSLHCLACQDIPSARDCSIITECGPHEVCYAQQVVSPTGRIFRRFGCRDSSRCAGTIVGRRDSNMTLDTSNVESDSTLRNEVVEDVSQDLVVCGGCCDSLWCQSKLCNDQAILPDTDRGPICFNCENVFINNKCIQIRNCGHDEACVTSLRISAAGNRLKQYACISKSICERIAGITLAPGACWNCCNDDLCNNMCDSVTTPVPSTTGHSGQMGHCTDGTPASTCQLASSIVCRDQTHATNAGCSHFCGYC